MPKYSMCSSVQTIAVEFEEKKSVHKCTESNVGQVEFNMPLPGDPGT